MEYREQEVGKNLIGKDEDGDEESGRNITSRIIITPADIEHCWRFERKVSITV